MHATFERFAEQEFWQSKDLDPFVRSHPVAADRLNQLREKVARAPTRTRRTRRSCSCATT